MSAVLSAPSLMRAAATARALGDLSIEELMEVRVERVVSASKYEQKVTRVPASVTVVSGDEIEAFGHRTLSDVLRTVRGLYTTNDGNYSYLGVRGFLRPGDYNVRSLVLVDGHRMNDNVYDGVFVGHEGSLSMDLVERVEVIRGPSSSIYGSSAFFGVVNIITKKDLEGARVIAEGGTYGTYRGEFDYGTKLKSGWKLLLSASAYQSDGRDAIYYPEFDPARSGEPRAVNHGYADGADGEQAYKFFARATLNDFTATVSASRRFKTVPTASYGTAFNTPRERTRDDRGYIDLVYRREIGADTGLKVRGLFDSYAYQGDYPTWDPLTNPADAELNKDKTSGEWGGVEVETTHRIAGKHTVVAGVEFRHNLHQDQSNYYESDPDAYLIADHRSGRHYGIYAQGDFALTKTLTLSAGLRRDEYPQGFGGTTNPRAALIWQASEQTVIKALYGEAFRAPNVYERYYYPLTSRELMPETMKMKEIVLEHYFRSGCRASISAYQYRIAGLIEQLVDPNDNLYFGNSASARAHGVEVELDGKFAPGWNVRTSYAWQRTEDAQGQALTGSPRAMAKLNLITPPFLRKVSAAFEAQYQSSVRTLGGNSADAFLIGNLTLNAPKLLRGVDVSLSLYNLFGTRHRFPGAEEHLQDTLPQEGRSLRLRAVYRF